MTAYTHLNAAMMALHTRVFRCTAHRCCRHFVATEPGGGSAEQLARVARAASEKYARLARELNIKAN
jgi:hypothetical protein